MCRAFAVFIFLLAPTIVHAASHEEVLRLNAVQQPGAQVICHVPITIVADNKPVILDYKNSMTVIAN